MGSNNQLHFYIIQEVQDVKIRLLLSQHLMVKMYSKFLFQEKIICTILLISAQELPRKKGEMAKHGTFTDVTCNLLVVKSTIFILQRYLRELITFELKCLNAISNCIIFPAIGFSLSSSARFAIRLLKLLG